MDRSDTLIIVGKGNNLSTFVNNYDLYKHFDVLGLNDVILLDDINFKYYIQQDFIVINGEIKDIKKKD